MAIYTFKKCNTISYCVSGYLKMHHDWPMQQKYNAISEIASKHGIDIKTAALQFAEAPSTVASIIPGARTAEQINANVASMKVTIPDAFWSELKAKNLIEQNAPV